MILVKGIMLEYTDLGTKVTNLSDYTRAQMYFQGTIVLNGKCMTTRNSSERYSVKKQQKQISAGW